MSLTRRNLLRGFGGALIAAPFVAQSGILMPVKQIVEPARFVPVADYLEDAALIDKMALVKKHILSHAIPREVLYSSRDLERLFPSTITFRRP